MHITHEMRDSKTPEGKFVSSHFESQIRLGPMPQWDNAVYANSGDFREAIWIDRVVGFFANERHRDVWIHRADDVRDEHGPVREINAEIRGSCLLFAAMNNRVGDKDNSIGHQNISTEIGEGLLLHEKIRRGQSRFHSESCRILPIARGFGGQVGRLDKFHDGGSRLMLFRKQWLDDSRIDSTVYIPMKIPIGNVAAICDQRLSFGPADLQVRKSPKKVGEVKMRFGAVRRYSSEFSAAVKPAFDLEVPRKVGRLPSVRPWGQLKLNLTFDIGRLVPFELGEPSLHGRVQQSGDSFIGKG